MPISAKWLARMRAWPHLLNYRTVKHFRRLRLLPALDSWAAASKVVTRSGHTLSTPMPDAVGFHYAYYGQYEYYERHLLRQLADFTDRSVFVDVGAHIGSYAVTMAREFDHVIAVEPNPAIRPFLELNIRDNAIANCDIVAAGLADERATRRFLRLKTGHNTSGSRLLTDEAGTVDADQSEEITVDVFPGDDLLPRSSDGGV